MLSFPVGTVIAKTFSYPHDMTDLSQGEQLLETRIEMLREDGWYGFSYVWNDQQTEATLALGAGTRSQMDPFDGTPPGNDSRIPMRNQCLNCHNQAKEFVPLGPTAANLNRSFAFAHGEENQLDYLSRLGMLAEKPATEAIEKLVRFDDPNRELSIDVQCLVGCELCSLPQSNRDSTNVGFGSATQPIGSGQVRRVENPRRRRTRIRRTRL